MEDWLAALGVDVGVGVHVDGQTSLTKQTEYRHWTWNKGIQNSACHGMGGTAALLSPLMNMHCVGRMLILIPTVFGERWGDWIGVSFYRAELDTIVQTGRIGMEWIGIRIDSI